MSKNQGKKILTFSLLVIIGLALVIILMYQVPSIKSRLSWRVDVTMTYLRGVIFPVKPFPTPAESITSAAQAATNTPTIVPTLVPSQPTATTRPNCHAPTQSNTHTSSSPAGSTAVGAAGTQQLRTSDPRPLSALLWLGRQPG